MMKSAVKMRLKCSSKCLGGWSLSLMLVILFNVTPSVEMWRVVDDSGYLFENDSCVLKTGQNGICTRIESCTIYINALISETMTYSELVRCSFDDDFTEIICCPHPKAQKVIITNKIGENKNKAEEEEAEDEDEEFFPNRKIKVPLAPRIAGIAHFDNRRPSEVACERYKAINSGHFHHNMGGMSVTSGKYSHIATLVYKTANGSEVKCAGSLISERFVLTAAHCLIRNDLIKVILGATSLLSTQGVIFMEIDKKFIPSSYELKSRYHDIGLIRLKENVPFSHRINPACLHSNPNDIDSRVNLTVSGWGFYNTRARTKLTDLIEITANTMPLKRCKKTKLNKVVSLSLFSGINDGQYCALEVHLNSPYYNGITGSPLQLFDGQKSTIVGIVSFEVLHGIRFPSVFTRVAYYLNWIERIVWGSI